MANVALSLLLMKTKLFINIDTLCVGRRGVAKALKSLDHGIQEPGCVETRHVVLRILMA